MRRAITVGPRLLSSSISPSVVLPRGSLPLPALSTAAASPRFSTLQVCNVNGDASHHDVKIKTSPNADTLHYANQQDTRFLALSTKDEPQKHGGNYSTIADLAHEPQSLRKLLDLPIPFSNLPIKPPSSNATQLELFGCHFRPNGTA